MSQLKVQSDPSYTPVAASPDEEDGRKKEPSSKKRVRYMKQVGLFVLTTLGHINFGMGLSWPNTIASDIQRDNKTLLGTEMDLSDWQLDMTSSLLFVGTLPGFLFGGWLVAKLGRRRSMMVVVLPCVLGWSFVAFSFNPSTLLIGRFINGMAYALLVVAVRTYLSEISDTAIRGAAILSAECMKSLGAILIVGIGMLGTWYQIAFFCIAEILFFGLVVVPFLPESPTYLTVTGKEDEARSVLRRLRGSYFDLETEISQLKKHNVRSDGSSGWGVLLKKDIMRKCLIVFGLFGISNFCGTEVIKANAVRILQTSGLSFDRDASSIVVFVLLLGGNIFQALMVDRVGRKKCLILSLVLLVFAYTILGTYVFIESSAAEEGSDMGGSWNWIPTVCLMVCAFSSSLGIGPTPWMLAVEYFPTSIRSQVMSVCTFFGSLMSFASLQVYSPLQEALTPAGLYWSYSCFAIIGIIYTLTIVEDTTGQKVG
ncbi:facilitated trehalose transporter Tret1-like [Macrobrachium rosenbergii]|uniref:facilitated trehalose transporter Tret1-like n=1 Tax=Macrobrachium rosenbergii TaxID=79674 RepID=UPI0034D5455E